MITLASEVLNMLCDNYGMNFDRFAKIEKTELSLLSQEQDFHWQFVLPSGQHAL